MAAPTVTAGTPTTTSGTSINLAVPAGAAAGDLLLAWVAIDATAAIATPPAGWTALWNQTGLHVFSRVAGGSEPSTYAWAHGSSLNWVAVMALASGVAATPIEASGATTGQATASPTSPSVAIGGADRLAFWSLERESTTRTVTGKPAGSAWVYQDTTPSGALLGVAYSAASGSSTGTGAWTISASTVSLNGVTIAVAPAAGGGGTNLPKVQQRRRLMGVF